MARSQAELVALGKRYLYPNYKQPPLVMVRGQGCELWDAEGKRYLDLYAGIAVHILGHVHPAVTAAIAEQAGTLMQVSNYFFNAPNVELAARLCTVAQMDRVFFCNSGSEAIEAMLKLARRHYFAQGQPQRNHVLAFNGSFHGRTLGALAATGQPSYREGFGVLPGVTHVPYGDLDAVTKAIDDRVCAILVEPVQGEGGVLPAPAGFLQGLRALADQRGLLLLADEIQSGLGRTGRFLAFEHAGVKPDAAALAKGLAGAIPIGAMLCGEHLAAALPPGSHGSTFGGNPLASRAALVVLEVLEQQNLVQEATRKGAVLDAALQTLCEKHPKHLRSTRGVGLLRALVLHDHVDARALQGRIRDLGVLVTVAGSSTLRFTPPLIITDDQIAQGLAVIDRALTSLD
ncbi:MAG TPA: acetylornithine/succinylornithine family transaminase [Polyangiaceae bacterium]|nr:acetylornithine/succinylornithine family transaminase [Polyangiaceae bacterium]